MCVLYVNFEFKVRPRGVCVAMGSALFIFRSYILKGPA